MRSRSYILPIALAFAFTGAQAQSLFDVGPKAGISSDDLDLEMAHNTVLGWHAGVFARVKAPLLPGLQGEVLLSSVGTNALFEGDEARVRATALRVPLFLFFSLGPAEIHLGGYMDRTLSSTTENGIDSEGNTTPSGGFNDGGYGLLGGAGLHFGRLYLGARYNYGLESLGDGPGFLSNASNRQFQFYAGFGLVGNKDK
jgi:hypothetical protein